jgi:hypothetical protein
MEKKKSIQRTLTFLTGTIFGGLLFGVFLLISGSKPPESSAPASNISLANAKSYYRNYLSGTPVTVVGAFKGFAVDLDAWSAMNMIMSQNSKVKGFRVYFGVDNSNNKIGIVVGIDNTGHDIATDAPPTIYLSSRTYDPCPPICDAPSPILQN